VKKGSLNARVGERPLQEKEHTARFPVQAGCKERKTRRYISTSGSRSISSRSKFQFVGD
jgi:hypothetical protein